VRRIDLDFLESFPDELALPRREFVLREPCLGHVPEFGEFFRRRFSLEQGGRVYWWRTQYGRTYELRFHSTADPFGPALDIFLLLDAGDPIPREDLIDADIWSLFRWCAGEVGGEWEQDAIDSTASIYKVPVHPLPDSNSVPESR